MTSIIKRTISALVAGFLCICMLPGIALGETEEAVVQEHPEIVAPAEEKQQPVEEAPAAPAQEVSEPAAPAEEKQQPAEEVKAAPAQEASEPAAPAEEKQQPAEEVKAAPAQEASEPAAPAEEKQQPAEEVKAAPAQEASESAAPAEEKQQPAEEVKAAPAQEASEPAAPAEEKQQPVEEAPAAPAQEASEPAAPVEEKQQPAEEAPAAPAQEASEPASPAEEKQQPAEEVQVAPAQEATEPAAPAQEEAEPAAPAQEAQKTEDEATQIIDLAGQSYYITRGGWFLNDNTHLRTSDPGAAKTWTFVESGDGTYYLRQGKKYLGRNAETDQWELVTSLEEAGTFQAQPGENGSIRLTQQDTDSTKSYIGLGTDPKDHKFEFTREEADEKGGIDLLLFQDIDLTGDSYILYTQGYDQNYYAITAEQAEDGIRCTAAQVEIVNGDSGTVRSVGDTDPVYWSFDKQGAVKSNIFTTLQTEEGEEQTVYLFADNKTQTLTTSDDVKGFNISVRNEGDYGEGNLYRFVGSQSRKAPVYEGGSFSISGTIDILNAWFRLAKLFVDEGIEAAQESAAVQEPEAVTEPAVVEEPEVVEEPVAAEEPALAEEPEVVEEPVAVEEPEVIEEPVAAQEPEVVEEPVAVEEPVVAQKPMVAEEPAVPARPVAEGKSRRSVKTASAAASIAAQTDDDLMDIEEETVPLAAFFREELPREELDEMTVEAAPAAASIAAQESTDLNDDLMDIEEEDVPLAASLPEELPSQAAPEEELPRMVVEAAPLAASFSEIDSDPAPVSGSVFSGIDLVELVMTALLAIVILLAGKQSMPVTLLGLGLAAMAVVVFFATEDLTGIICWTAVPSWQLTGLFALELMLTFWTLGNKLVSFGRVQIA